jgi:hypothetical protein
LLEKYDSYPHIFGMSVTKSFFNEQSTGKDENVVWGYALSVLRLIDLDKDDLKQMGVRERAIETETDAVRPDAWPRPVQTYKQTSWQPNDMHKSARS